MPAHQEPVASPDMHSQAKKFGFLWRDRLASLCGHAKHRETPLGCDIALCEYNLIDLCVSVGKV